MRLAPSFLAASARAALAGLTAVALAGCGLLGPDKPKPTPLEPIASPATAQAAWTQRVESVRFPLSVAQSPNVYTVASSEGTLLAVQADIGRELWRVNVKGPIAAGVGSDGRYASVVTRDGELVTVEAGRELWRTPLGLRVATAPLVAGDRVFLLGIDRSVHAFDAQNGAKLWSQRRPGEPLVLNQSGVLAAFKDTLLVGQGPRLAGLDPNNGDVRWEAPIGAPRGTNELERLADLVAPIARVGDTVCARSFQAGIGCVNADRGAVTWTKPGGGTDGLAGDEQIVVGADASDRVVAWKTASGDLAWNHDKLMHRGLGAPLVTPRYVVFGDADGLVHFLSRDTGEARLRLTTDGSPIVATPVQVSGIVLVVTRNGGLFAFRPE